MSNDLRSSTAGFGAPWLALCGAFALHIADEALTGFLNVYNPTVEALRARLGWWPMPTYQFQPWLTALIVGWTILFCLTPLAWRGLRPLRPLAWIYAAIMLLNGVGHTVFTIMGRTVLSVTFLRPAPGFYSSPFLLAASVCMIARLLRTR